MSRKSDLETTTGADKTQECSQNDHTNAAYVLTLIPLPVLTTHGGYHAFGLSVVGGPRREELPETEVTITRLSLPSLLPNS